MPPVCTRQVFDRHLLGASSEVAAVMHVDGSHTVLRSDLGAMLNEILGRQVRVLGGGRAANAVRAGGCCVHWADHWADLSRPGRDAH